MFNRKWRHRDLIEFKKLNEPFKQGEAWLWFYQIPSDSVSFNMPSLTVFLPPTDFSSFIPPCSFVSW